MKNEHPCDPCPNPARFRGKEKGYDLVCPDCWKWHDFNPDSAWTDEAATAVLFDRVMKGFVKMVGGPGLQSEENSENGNKN